MCQTIDWKPYHRAKCRVARGIGTADEMLKVMRSNPLTALFADFWRMNLDKIEPRLTDFVEALREVLENIDSDIEKIAKAKNLPVEQGSTYTDFVDNLPIVVIYMMVNRGRYIVNPKCECANCISGKAYVRIQGAFNSSELTQFFGWRSQSRRNAQARDLNRVNPKPPAPQDPTRAEETQGAPETQSATEATLTA
jgi:hypothetical protein